MLFGMGKKDKNNKKEASGELPLATLVKGLVSVKDHIEMSENKDILPCEKILFQSDEKVGYRLKELYLADNSLCRIIPASSYGATKLDAYGLPVPKFALINPFEELDLSWLKSSSISTLRDEWKYNGVLITEMGYRNFNDTCSYTINSGALRRTYKLGKKEIKPFRKQLKEDSTITRFYSSIIPGMIPKEYREKIKETQKLAKKVGGECLLLAEANWTLLREERRKVNPDPLIVIRIDEQLVYVDRFDCTPAEEHLAREHAVDHSSVLKDG